MQGELSHPFTAMVAALDVLYASKEPDGVRIVEIGLRGADKNGPVHAMQLLLLSEGTCAPAVHVAFANITSHWPSTYGDGLCNV